MPKANTRIYRVSVTRECDGQVSHGFQVTSGSQSVTVNDWPDAGDLPLGGARLFNFVASRVVYDDRLMRMMREAVDEGLVYVNDALFSCGRDSREVKEVPDDEEEA